MQYVCGVYLLAVYLVTTEQLLPLVDGYRVISS